MRKRKKKGTPFEHVVAEVLRAMDPGATVQHGQWVQGPDGHRELDVHIIGTYQGQQRRVLIECKDFSPTSTGPVGIGHVDALESKTRDLGFHFAAVCSNAGFTEGAVRKASRVGIGLISVMKKGDERIRFAVSEEIYTRKIRVTDLKVTLEGPAAISLEGVKVEDILFDGAPVGNWVTRRAGDIITFNPIVAGPYTARYPFTQPLEFALPSGAVAVSQLTFRMTITGGWFAHQVTLDATHGIYDWLRHRIRLAPGPSQFFIQGVDVNAGTPIEQPPTRELEQFLKITPGEVTIGLLLISGLEPREPVPDIDKYVRPDDLAPFIPNLPPESYTSVGP